MDVILTQDVKGLGKKNQMVKASDGYARNFLLPKGLAVEATKANVNEMNAKTDAERARMARERAAALEQQKALSSISLSFAVKGGANGKLFGSVTNKEISEALRAKHGLEIDRKKIEVDAIKAAGQHTATIKLYPQISAKITINVTVEV
ncbi:MAG: 50S ribosomal protein L9 [Clostridia bacterium]|nr:50S ribosomal protein L9 [Clostridia bacterium]